jgi:solute carrier family 8 (sodium/calcium exchanger)
VKEYPKGKIVEYTNLEEFCHSYILPPAFGQRNHIGLFFIYFFMIVYLFIGISIISDVFMDSIEVITSQTRTIVSTNADGEKVIRKTNVWNPTLANLTLMALGSSAPEIILNIYETLITFGETPGELGASTIVGSAAFNFFVISGISIYSVSEDNDDRDEDELEEDGTPLGVKKIYDMGVFTITCTASMLAYIWAFYCLIDYEVTVLEAWLTLGFMFVLLILAYIADKHKAAQ